MITCPHCGKDFTNAPTLELDGEKNRRAMRLPDDFIVPEDWRRWARQTRPGVDASLQAQLFANHWTAKSGKDATKKDWFKTWQNWILQCRLDPKSAPAPRVNPSPAAPRASQAPRAEPTDQQRAETAKRIADAVKRLPADFTAKPEGKPAPRNPAEVLANAFAAELGRK